MGIVHGLVTLAVSALQQLLVALYEIIRMIVLVVA
jgi:hypothetical protein